ncbi:MAG: hypothetical protein ACYSX0_01565 [Planctomycetota bacterium]
MGWRPWRVLVWILLAVPAHGGDDLDIARRWQQLRRVTVVDKKITVDQAVARICKRTGHRVVVDAKQDYEIALRLENVTFFEALDTVAQRSGMVLWGMPQARGGLRLSERPEGMRWVPPVHKGPVRIALLGIYSSRNASRRFTPGTAKGSTATDSLWIELNCLVEEGLGGVHLTKFELERAMDESERSLLGTTSTLGNLRVNRTLRFDLKAKSSSLKLVELRGRATLHVPAEVTELRFSRGARRAKRELGPATFTLIRITKSGRKDVPELVVRLEGDTCPRVEMDASSRLTRVYVSSTLYPGSMPPPNRVAIYLEDRKGKVIKGRITTLFDAEDGAGAQTFTLSDLPSKVIVRAITRTVREEVPFRFRDIPIPR